MPEEAIDVNAQIAREELPGWVLFETEFEAREDAVGEGAADACGREVVFILDAMSQPA